MEIQAMVRLLITTIALTGIIASAYADTAPSDCVDGGDGEMTFGAVIGAQSRCFIPSNECLVDDDMIIAASSGMFADYEGEIGQIFAGYEGEDLEFTTDSLAFNTNGSSEFEVTENGHRLTIFGDDGTLLNRDIGLTYCGAWTLMLDSSDSGAKFSFSSRSDLPEASPRMSISPPTGTYYNTQQFDFVIHVKYFIHLLSGVSIKYQDVEIAESLEDCWAEGTVGSGGTSYRCALKRGELPSGVHTVDVTLDFADGKSVSESVEWIIEEVYE